MSTNANEPIYPQLDWGNQGNKVEGLTKREYFAAMVIQGLSPKQGSIENIDWEYISKYAINGADALIASLNQ